MSLLFGVSKFLASGVTCGLKASGQPDLALIFSPQPCAAAGVFTRSLFAAAPVVYDRQALMKNPAGIQAIVINSGIANACTGEEGLADARRTAEAVAQKLGIPPEAALVLSTGVIGQRLPMEKIESGIGSAAAALSESGLSAAARAIMTTDTRAKTAHESFELNGRGVAIAGIAKGSGMIHPDMATMLSVILTNASVSPALLQSALKAAVDKSFNCVTVDGDTSTNDTVLLLASGAAAHEELVSESSLGFPAFQEALERVCISLARQIARDGEGATKLVQIRISGASSWQEARQAGRTVATSPLVKTALYGNDPNWGRILAALGRAGVPLDPQKIVLHMGALAEEAGSRGTLLMEKGAPCPFDAEKLRAELSGGDVLIEVDLGMNGEEATVWTCDLSYDYVRINAEYHT